MTKPAKAGDVIMSVRAPVGDLNVTPVDMCLGRGVCSLRMKNGNQDFLFYMMKYYIPHLLKKEINEYLYCYLKCFNYQTMGSTSSIATAVNSKIIKGMPFVVPTNDELEEFHGFAAPIFAKINANQIESENLTALRDTLLPKLMSGELDISDIDL